MPEQVKPVENIEIVNTPEVVKGKVGFGIGHINMPTPTYVTKVINALIGLLGGFAIMYASGAFNGLGIDPDKLKWLGAWATAMVAFLKVVIAPLIGVKIKSRKDKPRAN